MWEQRSAEGWRRGWPRSPHLQLTFCLKDHQSPHLEKKWLERGQIQKTPSLVFSAFSLGPLIEDSPGSWTCAIHIDYKNPTLPSNCNHSFLPGLHKNVILLRLKHSPKTHHLNPEPWHGRKWSGRQRPAHNTEPLFLEHVVRKTGILIMKVIGSIKVYLQRYNKQESDSVYAPYFRSPGQSLP